MVICNHHIRRSQIIGIGPLMLKRSNDQVQKMLYNSSQLFFQLHLIGGSILIESEWFYLQGDAKEQNEHNKQDLKKWEEMYHDAKETIVRLIGDE